MTDKQTVERVLEQLRRKEHRFPAQGGGSIGTDANGKVTTTSYTTDDGLRLVNPDGPEAAELIEALTRQAQVSDEPIPFGEFIGPHLGSLVVSDDAVVERLAEPYRNKWIGDHEGMIADLHATIRAALSATNSEAVSELTSAADELTRWYGPFNPTKHPPEINGAWLRLTDALAKLGSRAPEDTP
jgi:hypothetical protein